MSIKFLCGIDVDNGVLYTDTSNNRVGINTSSPQVPLEAKYTGTVDEIIRIVGPASGKPQLTFYNDTTLHTKIVAAGNNDFSITNTHSTGDMFFAAGGATRLHIEANGNVGIGTISPGAKLDVVSGDIRLGTNATYFRVRDTASAQPRVLGMNASNTTYVGPIDSYAGGGIVYGASGNVAYHGFYGGGSEKVRITSAGDVGIGETNPAQKLHVIGNSEITGDIFLGRYIFHNDDNDTWMGFPLANTISFRTTGSDRMYINSFGNVGIGTTSPGYKLDVNGKGRFGDNGGILLTDDSGTSYVRALNNHLNLRTTRDDDDIYFSTGTTTTTKMFIEGNTGNVGIGTTGPASQVGSTKVLDISSTGNGEIILDHTDAGISSDIGLYSWNRNNDHLAHIKATCDGATDSAFISFHAQPTGGSFSNAASNEKMRIKSNGDVGIGTTAPGRKLHVAGTARVDSTFYLGTDDNCAFFRYFNSLVITNSGNTSIQFGGGPGNVNNNLFVGNGYLDVNGYIRGKNYFYLEDAAGTLRTTLRSESTYATLDNGTNTLNTIANAHIFLRSTTEIMRVHTNNNVGIGTSSPGEKLEVNGTVKATAATDAYKGYIKQNVISYAAEKVESSNYNFTSYNTTSTVTTAQAYNRIVAAYNGRVKKVYIRHAGASTPTATAVNFKKHTNGTTSSTVYSATVANTASTNMTAYYEFGNNDFTFNAGDLIGLLYQTTDAFGTGSKTMGGVAVTITLEYNIT